MDSKYLFVPNDMNHGRLIAMTRGMGLPDDYWKFLIGEKKDGHINGKDIKNNNNPTQIGDYTLYEFDRNIVAQLNAEITTEAAKHADVLWLTREEAIQKINEIGGEI